MLHELIGFNKNIVNLDKVETKKQEEKEFVVASY